LFAVAAFARAAPAADQRAALEVSIVQHATDNGVPVALVRRVIQRESGFNPRMIYRGNYGLMQIRLGTARRLGYRGAVEGLLDPETNMTYAVRYLAGAYRAARGNEARAIALYRRGY
jgi:soluble lytic murein transglycosylase-like protein